MSDQNGSSDSYINQLVHKAIERKKHLEQQEAQRNKPKLEYVLFSQFDVLESFPSLNGKTTLYHLAKKGEPEKQVCCKVANEGTSAHEHTMLIGEASKLEMSQHPSVADFIKVGNEFDRPYIMYQWINGESLAEKLERHAKKGFRHDHIAWFIYQLAGALEYMHTRGVCHLDVKPANVLVGEDDSVKLIDFGAARYSDELQGPSEVSLSYASPLYVETGVSQPQDDVYSLALLTGHLFLGSTYGDMWRDLLAQKKRCQLIPKHVWRLLKTILSKPRSHGYTAISFAQALAQIDTAALKSDNSAPIFTNLRNADLVLTQHRATDRFSLGRFKYLEAALVASVVLVTGTYVYDYLQPEWKPSAKSGFGQTETLVNTIKPAQTASFLAQTPWEIERVLDDMSSDVVVMAPYRDAYHVQQSQLLDLYQRHQERLDSRRKVAENVPVLLNKLRSQLVSLHTNLNNDGMLFASSERSFTQVMANLNQLSMETQNVADYVGKQDSDLVNLILSGQAQVADDYMKEAWLNRQAESYYYSQVLPHSLLTRLYASIEANAEKHFYTRAIEQAQAAMDFFGKTPDLNAKVRALKVARSEYILFSTVTEQGLFARAKLTSSLNELEVNAPNKFSEVTEVLNGMANDAIRKSHKKSTPARGALAVQRAINDYQQRSGSQS
ncbi:serine/threonine protein kinase [Vibrio ostreicida]|uniref:Protein kinase family protein n=1 Tax=Vibrio ostreicida TaxID=526588 RepID=A0ABT8C099_9VIBR|nr:protein kinase family protein [Vibrio ostreicida]MDN3611782.1 protein kinase family protein [Vibrio ostreicida]NPD09597.1 protein kinase family protein [Vibrio ostreicida]